MTEPHKELQHIWGETPEGYAARVKAHNEPEPRQPPESPEWQPIFDEVGYDIMDIVMDFQHGRKSAGETMDRISDFALAAYRRRADSPIVEEAALRAAKKIGSVYEKVIRGTYSFDTEKAAAIIAAALKK